MRGETRTWLERALETTTELDYAEALDWFGLRMTPPLEAPRPWLGLAVRTDNQRTIVSEVRRGSPASAAGVSVGDEITAINGERLAAGQLTARIESVKPGARIILSVTRQDVVRPLAITLGTDPGHGWALSVSPGATGEQTRNLAEWLKTR